jgi:hypothetical protein
MSPLESWLAFSACFCCRHCRGGPREAGSPCIELRADALIAQLAGAASATLHFPDAIDFRAIGADQLACEGMVLLALAFEPHGRIVPRQSLVGVTSKLRRRFTNTRSPLPSRVDVP